LNLKIKSIQVTLFIFLSMTLISFQNCSKISKQQSITLKSTLPEESAATTADASDLNSSNFFIRTDGGTPAQCNGMVNVGYSGGGKNLNCAWKSIAYALTMMKAPRIKAGDKLYIESGTYKIGYGQPGSEENSVKCKSSNTADCTMSAVPSGVIIVGNCISKPKLIGVEGISQILNLSKTSNATLKCLEITDDVECIDSHNTANGLQKKACKKDSYPRGEWATQGVYAVDSSDVLFDKVNIHGLARQGVHAGRLNNWTFQDSNIDGNGWAGFDGDVGSDSSDTGEMQFIRTSISWNGCVEMKDGSHAGCWGQGSGGNGHGIDTASTGGAWLFDKAKVEYNTSDGIDMLNVKNTGGNVTVKNSLVAHNAGNQIKTNMTSTIENNVVVGDCAYHELFGGTMSSKEYCRARGDTLNIEINGAEVSTVKNNTITGEGHCLISTDGTGGFLNITGNILEGRTDYTSSGAQLSCFNNNMGSGIVTKVSANLIFNVKEFCVSRQTCANPLFVNPIFETFDPHLQNRSPAIGYGAKLSFVATP
jgi:hypothetical protein